MQQVRKFQLRLAPEFQLIELRELNEPRAIHIGKYLSKPRKARGAKHAADWGGEIALAYLATTPGIWCKTDTLCDLLMMESRDERRAADIDFRPVKLVDRRLHKFIEMGLVLKGTDGTFCLSKSEVEVLKPTLEEVEKLKKDRNDLPAQLLTQIERFAESKDEKSLGSVPKTQPVAASQNPDKSLFDRLLYLARQAGQIVAVPENQPAKSPKLKWTDTLSVVSFLANVVLTRADNPTKLLWGTIVLCVVSCLCFWFGHTEIRRRDRTGICIVIVCIFILVYAYANPHLVVPGSKNTPKPTDRLFTDRTPHELLSIFENHTSIQSEELIKPFRGQWMKCSGPFGDVERSDVFDEHDLVVTLKSKPVPRIEVVMFYFDDPKWSTQLETWRVGKRITIIGQIKDIDRFSMNLIHCEIAQ